MKFVNSRTYLTQSDQLTISETEIPNVTKLKEAYKSLQVLPITSTNQKIVENYSQNAIESYQELSPILLDYVSRTSVNVCKTEKKEVLYTTLQTRK